MSSVPSCNVCYDPFVSNHNSPKTPRVLPCGHTFCMECVENITKNKKACPLRCYGTISSASVTKVNYSLITIIECVDTVNKHNGNHICSRKDCGKPSTLWCNDCKSDFCVECNDFIHSQFECFASHRTTLICKESYCTVCKTICCNSLCAMSKEHNLHRHSIIPISEIVDKANLISRDCDKLSRELKYLKRYTEKIPRFLEKSRVIFDIARENALEKINQEQRALEAGLNNVMKDYLPTRIDALTNGCTTYQSNRITDDDTQDSKLAKYSALLSVNDTLKFLNLQLPNLEKYLHSNSITVIREKYNRVGTEAHPIVSVDCSPDDTFIAVTGQNGVFEILRRNAHTNDCDSEHIYFGLPHYPNTGAKFVDNKTVLIFAGNQLFKADIVDGTVQVNSVYSNTDEVFIDMVICNDCIFLLTANKNVISVDAKTFEDIKELKNKSNGSNIEFMPQENKVLVVDYGNTKCFKYNSLYNEVTLINENNVALYFDADNESNKQVLTDLVVKICYSKDNQYVACVRSHGSISIFTVQSHKIVTTFRHEGSPITSICFSNDDNNIIIGTDSGDLCFLYF